MADKSEYRAGIGKAFCALLAQSEDSVTKLLAANPQFPSAVTLYRWRDQQPAFARLWLRSREAQAEHLMQKCLDLAHSADAKNAHAVRVKFDIYKFFASKLLPALYGDKPSTTSVSTSVAVVISPERLDSIRTRLDAARGKVKEVVTKYERKESLPKTLQDFDTMRLNGKGTSIPKDKENVKERHPRSKEGHSGNSEQSPEN